MVSLQLELPGQDSRHSPGLVDMSPRRRETGCGPLSAIFLGELVVCKIGVIESAICQALSQPVHSSLEEHGPDQGHGLDSTSQIQAGSISP